MSDTDETPPKEYPYEDELGPHIIIGPECFALSDASVLNWKGVNYVPQDDKGLEISTDASTLRWRGHNYVRQGDQSVEAMTFNALTAEDDELDSCPHPGQFDPGVPQ